MTLAIGDLQGCAAAFESLLRRADAAESVWLVGDLVNRGPDSLAVLRRVHGLGARAQVVLGNHDLHLLGLAAQARQPHRLDTLAPVLAAPDWPTLRDWLRHRPLAYAQGPYLMVHAGLFPSWSADQAVALSHEVERVLQGPDWVDFLRIMYGNTPDYWDDTLSGDDRLRAIVNGLTRMRYLDDDTGRMNFTCSSAPAHAPAGLIPWFEAPGRQSIGSTVIFGHWSTLGLQQRPNLIALDSGCVWGGSLCGVRLEDRRVVQVSCAQAAQGGGSTAAIFTSSETHDRLGSHSPENGQNTAQPFRATDAKGR